MKKTLAILCALVIALSCLALAGCGESKEIPADSPFIGTWQATKATLKDEAVDMDEVLDGGTWIFVLRADGTAEQITDDETVPGVWSLTKNGAKVKLDGSKGSVKFTLEGESLITKVIGMRIYLEKVVTLNDLANDVNAFVDDAASVASDAVSDAAGVASDAISDAADAANDAVSDAADAVNDAVNDVVGALGEALSGVTNADS